MDKKKSIIVAVIAVVIVVLVLVVFGMSKDVPKVSLDTIITVDGRDYSVDEFENFMYIRNEEAGDIAKELTAEETDEMVNEFMKLKLYVNAANSKSIKVPTEEIENFKKEYEDKKDKYSPYGITESDYLKYAEDTYKTEELTNNFATYYELPEEYYNELVESYSGDQKTYSFRIMTFYYEEEESGDVSGDTASDVSGEASGEVVENISGEASGEISGDGSVEVVEPEEDRSRATILATAQDVLNQVRNNSGDFAELAKEHSSYRYTFKGSGYTLINGEIEYATTPILESKLGNEELYNEFLTLTAGETTDLVEDEENNVLYFAKVETIDEGFVGEGDKELREILLMQYQESLVLEDVDYSVNTAALIRVFYK